MDAVTLHPLTFSPDETALGTDADAWFMALDGRAVRVGDDIRVLRVEGIHHCGSTLWIQVALFDDSESGFVLRVEATHSQLDVLETLRHYELTGGPFEIIKIESTTH